MAHTRVKNGVHQPVIQVHGEIIENMVLEFSTMKMVINMKVDGRIVSVTDKAHYGLKMIKEILKEITLVIGAMIKKKVEELCSLQMKTGMMDSGKKANQAVRVE